MPKRIFSMFILLLFMAIPSLARVTAPDANGFSIIGQKQLGEDLVASCAVIPGNWFEKICDDDAVSAGICTQTMADNQAHWPTVPCTQARVDNHLCSVNDLGRDVPHPQACQAVLDIYMKRVLKALATNGYAIILKNATGDPSTPGDVQDDQ